MPIKKAVNNDDGEIKIIMYKIKFIDSFRFMHSSLSGLVENLSEINNKDCNTCIEIENIKLECEFIGFNNNRLNYRYKECKVTSARSINNLIKNFRIHINFAMVIIINLYYF